MTINMCDEDALYGRDAAQALEKYIEQLRKRKIDGLTDKQVSTLIKSAKVLHNAIIQTNAH